jgi:5-methyltetrahydrofolate--homocysteine methyltransferase
VPGIADGAGDSDPLMHAVMRGLVEQSGKITEQLLSEGTDSIDVIDKKLIPALDIVGKGFEEKKVFLPQLLMSAEAAKAAFEVIRTTLEKSGKKGEPKGTVIVATVKGDIHDIGKNIVKVLLQNYDFNVIDMGKDVPPEDIVERTIKDHVPLVGLSALMTTTVPAMEETIKQLREKAPWVKVMTGGAVMTKEYSDMIGADRYCKDAMSSVRYAEEVFSGTR